ncbi:cytochrome P450 4V2-like [Chrysoperla carnea]|uniref:cytochrome P450 4V2-like n=1 Tax=Chrysoperla carnea TaxID=189513 RepID=UPI001D064389|nr:cytochrome P450 4V2-like [Chrysoperla carnea]
MFSSTLLTSYLQNSIVISIVLSVLVILGTCIYFSNIFRICYYASKMPGPRAYPLIGNATLFLESHEVSTRNIISASLKYQNTLSRLWLGPIPMILSSDPEIVQELLTNPNVLEKPTLMKLVWMDAMGSSILISNVPVWKHDRNIITRGFNPNILKSYFDIFVEKNHILTEKLDLELNKGTSFDIFGYLARTTLDAVCESVMGVNVNSYDESTYFNASHSAMNLVMIRILSGFKLFPFYYRFTKDYKVACKNRDTLRKFTENVIAEKRNEYNLTSVKNNSFEVQAMNKNQSKKSMLEYLLDFTKNNADFAQNLLRDEINLLIWAAYDTSATTLAFVLLHLANNKEIQTKLYHEIYEILKDKNEIEFDDLIKLKYMEMVIKESMRITATAPIITREVSEDIDIGNYKIPRGANIAIPIFTLHRNSKYWKDPLKFDPERFTPENIKKQHPFAFIPFSAGPRNCIGQQYAWMLMKTIIATLLNRYEFHTDLKLEELRLEASVTITLVNGHLVRITPRQKFVDIH